MSSIFGNRIKFSIFGQSHAPGIGIIVDGLPAGEPIDFAQVQEFMRRRVPGRNPGDTKRHETDEVQVISGIFNGLTCGAPLCLLIKNEDHHSKDYENLRNCPRPGHSDFPLSVKFGGFEDLRGGGHSSGRLTAPLCAAGAVCLQILEKRSVQIAAKINSISGKSSGFDEIIEAARRDSDSVGGIIECCTTGLPAGLGSPMFDGIENRLSLAIFGIPAVRGIEFGAGFSAAAMRGSDHNDPYFMENNLIKTSKNNHGGVLGGITTGMPLVFRVAIKPTPSISKTQKTVQIDQKKEVDLNIFGRHDACIVPRAVPVVEAVTACVLLDFLED